GVTYQPGIDTGTPAPVLGRLDTTAPVPSNAGLEAALGQLATNTNLGPSPAVVVADAVTGQVLWQRNAELTVVPASATKVLTAAGGGQRLLLPGCRQARGRGAAGAHQSRRHGTDPGHRGRLAVQRFDRRTVGHGQRRCRGCPRDRAHDRRRPGGPVLPG